MGRRFTQETKKVLADLDSRTLDRRAERLAELGTLVYDASEGPISVQMENFVGEAIKNHENGCFRSCIFCCAGAVEYSFRHEIIINSENPTEKMKNIENKRFSKIIRLAETRERLKSFIKDANYLRRLRNKISAHPLYLASPMGKRHEGITMEKETAIKDIKMPISFLDSEDPELKEMEDLMKNPAALDEIIEWRSYPQKLLHKLSLKAYLKMKMTINGIYPLNEKRDTSNP